MGETMVDTDLDSAERDLQMLNLNLMPKLNLMPMLILMLGTVKDLESMVGLAKDAGYGGYGLQQAAYRFGGYPNYGGYGRTYGGYTRYSPYGARYGGYGRFW